MIKKKVIETQIQLIGLTITSKKKPPCNGGLAKIYIVCVNKDFASDSYYITGCNIGQ